MNRPSVSDLAKKAQEVYDKWVEDQMLIIEQAVIDQLEKKKKEIIPKLLGFDDRWGRWEVDHCNGRAGNSPAGDYLRSACQELIKKWFDENLDMPKLPAEAQEDLRREFDRIYKAKMEKLVAEYATDKAANDFKELIEGIYAPKN